MGDQLNILKLDQYALRIKFYNFCEKIKNKFHWYIRVTGFIHNLVPYPTVFDTIFITLTVLGGVACILPKIDQLIGQKREPFRHYLKTNKYIIRVNRTGVKIRALLYRARGINICF